MSALTIQSYARGYEVVLDQRWTIDLYPRRYQAEAFCQTLEPAADLLRLLAEWPVIGPPEDQARRSAATTMCNDLVYQARQAARTATH